MDFAFRGKWHVLRTNWKINQTFRTRSAKASEVQSIQNTEEKNGPAYWDMVVR